MLPNFIIIGAMKGGTSSLYHYIASHPEVIGSSVKEPNFFLTTSNSKKEIKQYESYFKGRGEYAFEASTSYTKRHLHPGVPERMHSILPQVKLIYLVRDPLKRIISHYVHNYAHREESKAFSEIIKDPENKYTQTSKYYYQIETFLDYYPEKQLLVIESERLRKDPAGVLEDVFKFLGISSAYDSSLLKKHFHQSNKKKRRSELELALCRETSNPFLQYGIRILTRPFQKPFERPVLSEKDRDKLVEEIAPDIEKLKQFSGLSFSDWSLNLSPEDD